ncbi:MAG: TonB-dependent receptor [Ignavibacteriales bacterium]|nr:MAG: TonB-dependent receptor [Ignavibacteriales bacterium]
MKYLIILFLFYTTVLSAQNTVLKGKVLNSDDKSPIPFVTVTIETGKEIVTTNQEGNFEFREYIKPDEIILFSHVGFEPMRVSVEQFQKQYNDIVYLKSKIITSQTILVKGSIGNEGTTPVTFSKINKLTLRETYTNQDIPEFLSYQPSVTFYSENGNGLGYNYLSIRGFDQRRISVSINGIPQNDPEDNNVYWLDFPDLLESTELIQIQRGAGSGMAGYPAVGGSINIITSTFSDKPIMEFSSSIGSYNTRKYSAQFSSGLISNKYSFYAKVSQTLSSGYRNSSWIDFKSIHLSAVRYDRDLTTQINIYGGPIEDGLAYTGLPKFAIKNNELRKANYSYWEADDKKITYSIDRRPEEIENFSQPHFELLNELKLNEKITFNSALFLVLGNGFFDYDGSWADTNYFRITKNFGFNTTQNPGNALIRAMVENKQWGWIPRINIIHDNGELIVGGELRFHKSIHWGSILFADGLPDGLNKNYRYYEYNGGKDIFNFYVNEKYNLNEQTNLQAEVQLISSLYKLSNEKYLDNNFKVDNTFLNTRLGFNFKVSPDFNLYLNYARVSREPRLNNYYDAAESSGGAAPLFEINSLGNYDFSKPLVKPETMNDFEFGSMYSSTNMSLSFNLYYMIFNNEIVQQGQVDRFGQPITGNMDRTIHYGTELLGNFKLYKNLEFITNASLSKNYISKGVAFINYTDQQNGNSKSAVLNLDGNSISGFPYFTFNAILKYHSENFFLQFSTKYVSEFYTDNFYTQLSSLNINYPGITDYSDNRVDAYFVANLFLSYNLTMEPSVKNMRIFFQITNVFNNLYAAYGIGKEFFPTAERNYLFGIKLGL